MSLRLRACALPACLLFSSGAALAQDDASLTNVARHRKEDASVDRGFFNSHAETLEQGDVAINSYELLFLGVSGGLTDTVQISATTLLPITSEFPTILLLQGKYAFYRSAETTISARGNFSYFTCSECDGSLMAFGAGVAIDSFLDSGGRFAIHGAFAMQGLAGSGEGSDVDLSDGALISMEGGITARLTERFKLLVDILLPAAITEKKGFDVAEALLFTYGMRFHGPDLAADLGFMRPVGDVDTGDLVLGLPWVAFSARF